MIKALVAQNGKVTAELFFKSRQQDDSPIIPETREMLDNQTLSIERNIEKTIDETVGELAAFNKTKTIAHRHPFLRVSRHDFDGICPGCFFSTFIKGRVCGMILHELVKKNMTVASAGKEAAKKYPEGCAKCDPDTCSRNNRRAPRMDAAAPRELWGRSHYLQSIPATHRIPRSALSDLPRYFNNSENVGKNRPQYLFEYNPSVIVIPPGQQPQHLIEEKPVYLASFRVSTLHFCFPKPREVMKMVYGPPGPKNYLALAVLREDFSIIEDVVIDFSSEIVIDITKSLKNILLVHEFEDTRLFVLHNQIYLALSKDIIPVSISSQPEKNEDQLDLSPYYMFPSNLLVTLRNFKSCHFEPVGKNFKYFVDARNKTVVELYPMRGKVPIDLDSPCHKAKELEVINNPPEPLPARTFNSNDEVHFANQRIYNPKIEWNERGSACCVPFSDPRSANISSPLLMGATHSKTKFLGKTTSSDIGGGVPANSYWSSFYAMEPMPPYRVVAWTGKFCLGYPTDEEAEENPYAGMSRTGKLWFGESLECPRIHFRECFRNL